VLAGLCGCIGCWVFFNFNSLYNTLIVISILHIFRWCLEVCNWVLRLDIDVVDSCAVGGNDCGGHRLGWGVVESFPYFLDTLFILSLGLGLYHIFLRDSLAPQGVGTVSSYINAVSLTLTPQEPTKHTFLSSSGGTVAYISICATWDSGCTTRHQPTVQEPTTSTSHPPTHYHKHSDTLSL